MTLPLPDPVSEVKTTLILLAVLVVLGVFGYLVYTKMSLEKTVAEQQTDIVALTSANQDWKTQVDASNLALAKVQSEAIVRQKAVESALSDAQKQSDSLGKQILTIEATKPTNKDDCTAAKALADSYFGRIK